MGRRLNSSTETKSRESNDIHAERELRRPEEDESHGVHFKHTCTCAGGSVGIAFHSQVLCLHILGRGTSHIRLWLVWRLLLLVVLMLVDTRGTLASGGDDETCDCCVTMISSLTPCCFGVTSAPAW